MNINSILELLKIKKKEKPRDWSKSDQVVLDTFRQLQQSSAKRMQITPLNQSSYNDRRFSGAVSPDFTGPMTGPGGIGTNDRMPGTTSTRNPEPMHIKKKHSKGSNQRKTSGLI